jgi:hypothetical protein
MGRIDPDAFAHAFATWAQDSLGTLRKATSSPSMEKRFGARIARRAHGI